jgi:hypothetical protein
MHCCYADAKQPRDLVATESRAIEVNDAHAIGTTVSALVRSITVVQF